ncbi:hypothetical protein EIP91_002428 [Steccherinum ochraceum]|uniref:Uncharacterized protein n=1 Tax=Steccherinum ochraceum TaxID=92696 RepID=A0A4R0RFW2_9APHY|nr:hypothetical protein EIP91_002428 [Steccherinum ochraceum]
MSHSVLASFDPLATHPFTNNSGLLPKPTPPSKYPLPMSSSVKTGSNMSAPSKQKSSIPLHAPQPQSHTQRTSPNKSSTKGPIFVPFRPDRASPDLDDILLKKRVSDVFANKQSWSIDQAHVSSLTSAPKRSSK